MSVVVSYLLLIDELLVMVNVDESGLCAEAVVYPPAGRTSAVDVVLFGLSVVVPLMNIEMLRVSFIDLNQLHPLSTRLIT